jgi:hypothetical protein
MDDAVKGAVHLVLTPGHTSLTDEVLDVLTRFEATPRPQFGDTEDAELSRFWLITVAPGDASPLISALLSSPDVDGAYTVPMDEPAA